MDDFSPVWIALLLAAGAGFSTTIGSMLGVITRRPGPQFMSFTLGFSAGIMIFISFVELLAKAVTVEEIGFLGANIAFFVGMGSYFLLDVLIPHEYIGQHDHPQSQHKLRGNQQLQLERTGLLVALGISIHNFPEGMATFVGAMEDLRLGLVIAIGIAIHNIPEGVAISAPIYAATGSRSRAFVWSFLSGISEVAGAVLAALVITPFLSEALMGLVMAAVAGIMVVISLDELIPAAKSFTCEHIPVLGIITGMIVMTISLWMLR